MPKKQTKKYLLIVVAIVSILAVVGITVSGIYSVQKRTSTQTTPSKSPTTADKQAEDTPGKPVESYQGVNTVIADTFSVKVPNGWQASISTNPSFLAIMFARPNQLNTLSYSTTDTPVIDQGGIPSWNGLTEHFFIIVPTASQVFNSNDHLEVSSKPFTFNDGTVGQNYYVVKHAAEAEKWGGLQKDTEWQGRTYIYEKDGKRVEAHLALYPSTNISIPFYEDVVRTLHF